MIHPLLPSFILRGVTTRVSRNRCDLIPCSATIVATCLAVLIVAPSSASAQHLPHNVPDLCSLEPSRMVVSSGSSRQISGSIPCLEVRGTVVLMGSVTADTIVVYPGGTLTLADGLNLTFRDYPIDTQHDPEQWGHGLVVIDGTVRANGRTVQSHMRLAAQPLAGHTTLTLAAAPVGWQVGDRIVLPDTRQLEEAQWFNASLALQHEVRRITAISGVLVTLESPLSFDHRGARDADGTLRLLPHVGNLTRSIVVRSESPNGVRGHIAFLGRSDVQIRGVSFVNLGRTTIAPLHSTQGTTIGTNQIGRYPVHFHHSWGPVNPSTSVHQFVFQGNAIEAGLKWPLAIHGSHFGLAADNVIFGAGNLTGAGIALEDGSETENLLTGNFVVGITGNANPRMSLPDQTNGSVQGSSGDCIWAAGFKNRFVNNVLAGCRNSFQTPANAAGFKFGMKQAAPYQDRNPKFRGADMSDPTQTIAVTPQMQPILEHRGNEVYGLAATGLTVWYLGTDGYQTQEMAESLVQDFTVWHTFEGVYWGYPSNRLTFDGGSYRGVCCDPYGGPVAFTSGDYRTIDLAIRNFDVHAGALLKGLIDPVGTFTFQNVNATTRNHAYQFRTPSTPGTGARLNYPRPVAIQIFGGVITAWPGQPLRSISMEHNLTQYNINDPLSPYTVKVSEYQKTSASFQVYFPIQTTTAQFYGGSAPCGTTTYPEIIGVTCGTAALPPPPPSAPPPQPNAVTLPPPSCTVDWARLVRIEVAFGGVILVVFNNPAGCR